MKESQYFIGVRSGNFRGVIIPYSAMALYSRPCPRDSKTTKPERKYCEREAAVSQFPETQADFRRLAEQWRDMAIKSSGRNASADQTDTRRVLTQSWHCHSGQL